MPIVDGADPGRRVGLFGRLSDRSLANAAERLVEIDTELADRQALRPTNLETLDSLCDATAPKLVVSLSKRQCLALLEEQQVGRLAFLSRAGIPLIVPVNYLFERDAIFIRSGPGWKLQAAEREEVVSFEIDEIDQASRSGWSVVVTGKASRLRWSRADRDSSTGAPDTRGIPWAAGPRNHVLRIDISRVSGRRLLSGTVERHVTEP